MCRVFCCIEYAIDVRSVRSLATFCDMFTLNSDSILRLIESLHIKQKEEKTHMQTGLPFAIYSSIHVINTENNPHFSTGLGKMQYDDIRMFL